MKSDTEITEKWVELAQGKIVSLEKEDLFFLLTYLHAFNFKKLLIEKENYKNDIFLVKSINKGEEI